MTGPNPISHGAHRLACPAGTVLFRPDDACSGFVVLKEGSIRVSLTSAGGRDIVLYRVRPGEICLQTFTCLAEGRTYSAEGIAESELTGELIPPGEYERRMAEDPEFRRAVFTAVGEAVPTINMAAKVPLKPNSQVNPIAIAGPPSSRIPRAQPSRPTGLGGRVFDS